MAMSRSWWPAVSTPRLWGYDPWHGYYGYPHGPYPYPYPYYAFDPGSSVRVEVKPNKAEVYVDGYYASASSTTSDGVFQRLPVYPGEHEIEQYLDGYRAVKQRVYTARPAARSSRALRDGEASTPASRRSRGPRAAESAADTAGWRGAGAGRIRRARPSAACAARRRSRFRSNLEAQRPESAAYGSIAIRVQPSDAQILVDGDAWRSEPSQDRLVIQVAEGRHTIEVQKTGFRTYVTEVDVRRGEMTTVNVSLRAQNHD